MLLLDTNVLSAIMSREPPQAVADFIAVQPLAQLCTASVCKAEILAGIAVLPEGRRRSELQTAANAMFFDDFEGRILSFDDSAANAYAELFALRRKAGRPASTIDLMAGESGEGIMQR